MTFLRRKLAAILILAIAMLGGPGLGAEVERASAAQSPQHAKALSAAKKAGARAKANARPRRPGGTTRRGARVRRSDDRRARGKANNGNSNNANGNGGGNGNGNANGHGNGNANGHGNGNANGHGNGNGNGGGNGNGNSGNGYGNSGTPPGQVPAGNPQQGGQPNQGHGNGLGQTPSGSPNHGNAPTSGAPPKGYAPGHHPELKWLEQAVAKFADQAHEFRRLHLRAVKSGDRAEAKAAEKAMDAAVRHYFSALELYQAGDAYLMHRDAYLEALASGDTAAAAEAYTLALAAYGESVKGWDTLDADALPTAAPPEQGSTVLVAPSVGIVTVDPPGAGPAVPLLAGSSVPMGSVVDARFGQVSLTSAANVDGATQTATFRGAQFKVNQHAGSRLTDLVLTGGDFSGCSAKRAPGSAVAALRRGQAARSLWGNGKGRFRTRGRHGTATVRGTVWFTQDTCAGTRVRVKEGIVEVRDLNKGRTVELWDGDTYLARPPARRR